MVKKRLYIVLLIIISVFFPGNAENTDEITTLVEKYFSKVDSLFTSITGEPQLRMKEVDPADNLFKELIHKHPFFSRLIRTNSKGILVNEVIPDTESSNRYPDVSDQTWYAQPQKTSEPYYGQISIAGKKVSVMWSKPVSVTTKNDETRFGGVIAAQIDVLYILNRIASKYQGYARCIYNNNPFFQFSWRKTGAYEEFPVLINGKPIFSIQVQTATDTSAEKKAAKKIDTIGILKPSPASNLSAAADDSIAVKSNAGVQKAIDPGPDSKRPLKKSVPSPAPLKVILLAVLGFVMLGFLVFIVNRRRKNIDSGDLPVQVQEDFVPVIIDQQEKDATLAERGETIRQHILDEIKKEIRDSITEPEREKLSSETREALKKEVYEKITTEEGDALKEAVKQSLKNSFESELKDIIYENVKLQFRETFEKEAKENLQREILETISNNEAEKLEKEYLEKLKENISARVELENKSEIEKRAMAELEAEIKKRIAETETENLKQKAAVDITEQIKKEVQEAEETTIRARIRTALVEEITESTRKNESDKLYEQVLKLLEEEIRTAVARNESEQIRTAARNIIAGEIHGDILDKEKETILEEERERIRKNAALTIKNTEFLAIMNQQRDIVREEVHSAIVQEQSATIQAEEHKKIVQDIQNRIRTEELEQITDTLRNEITENVKKQLEENEREPLYNNLKKKLEDELESRVREKEIDLIRKKIILMVAELERKRILAEELPAIQAFQKKRIEQDQYDTLYAEARKQIYDNELESLKIKIKEQIYQQTVEGIKAEIGKELRASFDEKVQLEKNSIEKETQSGFRKHLQEEYHYLIGIVENMDTSLKKVEALNSLRHTTSRLAEEKNKYKFFNLNAQQTESLIEYLQRLQGNFDTYFDSLENTLYAVKIKINSILNRLGDDNALLR